MEVLTLLGKTFLLRPYVFLFLAAALLTARSLLGLKRTAIFFLIAWVVAFVCEYSSTRTGIPFGWYFYTGSTRGEELYISNVPFMDSLSFSFLLFCSYCLALLFMSPTRGPGLNGLQTDDPALRRSKTLLALTVVFFVLLDVVIDPVALRVDAASQRRHLAVDGDPALLDQDLARPPAPQAGPSEEFLQPLRLLLGASRRRLSGPARGRP